MPGVKGMKERERERMKDELNACYDSSVITISFLDSLFTASVINCCNIISRLYINFLPSSWFDVKNNIDIHVVRMISLCKELQRDSECSEKEEKDCVVAIFCKQDEVYRCLFLWLPDSYFASITFFLIHLLILPSVLLSRDSGASIFAHEFLQVPWFEWTKGMTRYGVTVIATTRRERLEKVKVDSS